MGSIALDLGVRIRAQLHCAVQFSGAKLKQTLP